MRPVLAMLLTACQTHVAPAVPPPDIDPSEAYEALLQRAVTQDGYVRWPDLVADRDPLDAYVAWLARDGALPDDPVAAHATWLNAYNAWVLLGVIEAGVPASVHDVPGWVPEPGSGFFLERTYTLGGQRVSLYTAEHRRIRATFHDWRDHAALNCASASCPPLRRELYRAQDLDDQLDDQVRRWVADPVRGFRADATGLIVSPIFAWYAADLPGGTQGLCRLLAPYAEPSRRALLDAAASGCAHRTFVYDWSLNHPERRHVVPPAP